MIQIDEAIALIESLDVRLPSQTLPLAAALGRIPTQAPLALVDQPPFDKATMDGFAYVSESGRLAGSGDTFALVGSVAAGSRAPPSLSPGECLRIMTGAPVPDGAFAVHRLERADVSDGRVRIGEGEGEVHILRRGANRLAGGELFRRRPLRPQDLGLLAANGIASIEVAARARVRVLSSGEELEAAGAGGATGKAGEALRPGRIYDSNGPQLVAQAEAFGCDASFGGIVADDESALCEAIVSAAEESDLVILSGGASAGDFDFTPRAAERAGFAILFHKVAMRPGMPAFLARKGRAFLYGMPGNPVSVFVNFEIIVKPLIRSLSGLRYEPPTARVRMGVAATRRETERVEFLPVEIREGIARPLRYTGSTMLDALAGADAIVRLEIGQGELPEGSWTDARLF